MKASSLSQETSMMDCIVPPKKGNQVGFPQIVDVHGHL